PRTHRQRRLRRHRPGHDSHHRPAHPCGRRSRGRVPALRHIYVESLCSRSRSRRHLRAGHGGGTRRCPHLPPPARADRALPQHSPTHLGGPALGLPRPVHPHPARDPAGSRHPPTRFPGHRLLGSGLLPTGRREPFAPVPLPRRTHPHRRASHPPRRYLPRALPRQRAATPPLQHRVPTRRRTRSGPGRTPPAHPRPRCPPPHRRAAHRTHQRLHHRTTEHRRAVGHRPHGTPGHPHPPVRRSH